MKLNKIFLRIIGGIELDQDVDTKKDIMVNIPAGIYAVEYRDCQDGTYDKVMKCKANSAVVITQGDKKIIAKDNSKTSKKNRDWIYYISQGYNVVDIESFYNDFFQVLRTDNSLADIVVKKMNLDKYK